VVAVCFFAIRNTAPPRLTTCGDQNLRAKGKRSGTEPDTLIAMTPRALLHDADTSQVGRCVDFILKPHRSAVGSPLAGVQGAASPRKAGGVKTPSAATGVSEASRVY